MLISWAYYWGNSIRAIAIRKLAITSAHAEALSGYFVLDSTYADHQGIA
jgi:hypothetical protein